MKKINISFSSEKDKENFVLECVYIIIYYCRVAFVRRFGRRLWGNLFQHIQQSNFSAFRENAEY